MFFFFFKQKTAYEMRISDWSSDVCSSDLFFRRFIIMPFNVTIPKEKRDKYLAKRIVKDELPGVFNWILKGLSRLLEQQGFSKYDAGDKALAEYQKVSNKDRKSTRLNSSH